MRFHQVGVVALRLVRFDRVVPPLSNDQRRVAAPGIAPPGAAPPSAAAPGGGASGTVALASGALGAAVGVIMQMRTAEQQNLSQPMMPTTPPNVVPMGPRM